MLALHGQLAAVAWALRLWRAPGGQAGVRAERGRHALPGGHSWTVRRALRELGLLAGHLTAGAAFGGEAGGDHHRGGAAPRPEHLRGGMRRCGWASVRESSARFPRPLGHGGMAALDSAHAALALGCPTLLVARMSSGDHRARHRGISHHTLTVLDLLLEPVTRGAARGNALTRRRRPARGSGCGLWRGDLRGPGVGNEAEIGRHSLDVERPVCITRPRLAPRRGGSSGVCLQWPFPQRRWTWPDRGRPVVSSARCLAGGAALAPAVAGRSLRPPGRVLRSDGAA